MEFIQISVTEREERGSGPAHRLRRDGFVPAVLYGLGKRNLALTIPSVEVERFLRTGSHLVELRLGEQARPAIIREVQHDPISDEILHIDFVRVDKDTEIEDDVILVFKGTPKGTKEGGVFAALQETVTVRCRPLQIPREIVIDVSHLALGDSVNLSEVTLPEGVTAVTPKDTVLANVSLPKIAAEPTEAPEGEAVEGEAAEGETAAEASGDDE
jgi:large subunit ribosomal protein L25